NSPGQFVVSGSNNAIEAVEERARDAGALKAVALDVSGPWHSRYMEPAREPLREALNTVNWSDGKPAVANVTADFVEASPTSHLIDQLVEPVRWIESIQLLIDHRVERFIEVGPADVLAGLVKRIASQSDRDVDIRTTDTIEETDKLLEEMN
ncbi:MAG: ACP S-malonyltransferase, partial [bacterium]